MRSLCVGPATQLRLPDHRIFAAGDSRTRCEEIRAPRAGPTCTLVCKARQDSGDRAGAADRRELSQQKPSLRRFAWQKEPQRQFCWCDLCAGDGLLLCNKCEGRKYVNTEPGQAGVQFFGGTARCSICQGVGTMPCPLCAGYEDRSRRSFIEECENVSTPGQDESRNPTSDV